MIILNSFPLIGPVIFSKDALAAESDPLCELIESLTFVRRDLNNPAQIQIADKAQQKFRAHNQAKFVKDLI
jgi:hypothetical protein